KKVADKKWRVVRECWIGHFSFHKLLMYQDLQNNGELINQHHIIRTLSEGKVAENDQSDPDDINLDPRKFDDTVSPHNLYGQFSFHSIPGIHAADIEKA